MKERKEPTFPLKTSKCISEFTEIYFTNTYLKAEAEAAVLVGRKTSQAMEKYFSFGPLSLCITFYSSLRDCTWGISS